MAVISDPIEAAYAKRDQHVHDLAAAGKSPADVAALCAISIRRVYQILGTRAEKPRITEEQRAEILRRRALGTPVRQIAAELHVSRGTVLRVPAPTIQDEAAAKGVSVRRVYQQRGVASAKPRLTPETRRRIAGMRAGGQSIPDIAAELGISRGSVQRVPPLSAPGASPNAARGLRGWSDEDVDYVRSRMATRNAGTIAREIGRPVSSVKKLMERLA